MVSIINNNKTIHYNNGDIIFTQGEVGNSLFSILSGTVKIVKDDIVIARRGPGELVGEMSLLEDEPRSATVVAASECEIVEYSRQEFKDVIREMPELALSVMRSLSNKLRESDILRLEELEKKNLSLTIKNRELHLINNFLEQLFHQSLAAIVITDQKGNIVRTNPAAQKIFKLGSGSVHPIMDYFDDFNPLETLWHSQESSWAGESNIKVGEEEKTLFISISRLLTENSKNQYLLICEDITEIKNLNDEILKLEIVNTAGNMAAEIAHDIKNYLSSIAGYFEMIKGNFNEEFLDKYSHYINSLESGVRKMKTYLEELMTNESKSGVFSLNNLRSMIAITLKYLRPQTRFKNITFNTVIDPDFPAAIKLDENQFQRVIINLLINSAEALNEMQTGGKKEIRIELHYDKPQQRVIIIFADNGPGINPNFLPNLFKKPLTNKKSGHGIGLMTVKKIIDNHSGTINIESESGKGTKFIITLPAKD